MQIGKLRKLAHFIGPTDQSLPPVFLNSMPKAGTNLFEKLLILRGYKRSFAPCYNEQNITRRPLNPQRGRFDVGHLFADEAVHASAYKTVYVRRPLWPCIRSYVNYMYIDRKHPASAFVRAAVAEGDIRSMLESLIFGADNPLERSLVFEYRRFYSIDVQNYDLVLDFDTFRSLEAGLVQRLGDFLGLPPGNARTLMERALEANTWTKNSGDIDVFTSLPHGYVTELTSRVSAHDLWESSPS